MSKQNYHNYRELETDCFSCREKIIDRVLRDMMHEIKNPMMQIGGFSERILKKLESGKFSEDGSEVSFSKEVFEKLEKYSEIIKREMSRLGKILDTAADFVSHQKLELKKINLHSLLREMIDLECDERINFIMNFNLNKEIIIDPDKIKMLVLNLLINAKEAIFDSKQRYNGVIKIITGINEMGQAFFEIINNGKSIPEDDIERIFNPFFTTKENSSGRGLAVSKAIVKSHKGKIEAMSSAEWTSFRVSLPLFP